MILIGYSGHAFVVHSILKAMGVSVTAYCDNVVKDYNPFNLTYLGAETNPLALQALIETAFFIAVGDNAIRQKIYNALALHNLQPINAIHPTAIICSSATIQPQGVMVSAGVIINPLAKIGIGSICNTGCIIEHECIVGNFAHIGPGAILCGNVTVGQNTFVGAGAVVKQGITIGNNVTIGAGAVVVKNIPDNVVVKGNPAR